MAPPSRRYRPSASTTIPIRIRLTGRPPSRSVYRVISPRSTTACAITMSVVRRCSMVSITRLTSKRTATSCTRSRDRVGHTLGGIGRSRHPPLERDKRRVLSDRAGGQEDGQLSVQGGGGGGGAGGAGESLLGS